MQQLASWQHEHAGLPMLEAVSHNAPIADQEHWEHMAGSDSATELRPVLCRDSRVMDQALAMHYACLRSMLHQHYGYEVTGCAMHNDEVHIDWTRPVCNFTNAPFAACGAAAHTCLGEAKHHVDQL